MTAEQVAALGPAFDGYLREFRSAFGNVKSFAHLGTYCRGLASDLPRKSVEPIALAAGTAARTLQQFLTGHVWDPATCGTRTRCWPGSSGGSSSATCRPRATRRRPTAWGPSA